jgi:peptide/nickel transport system permease protein/oligopeptide transport system permease protein
LLRNRVAVASLAVLAAVVVLAIFGPLFLPASYRELSGNQFAAPTLRHPFGTDLNGRDVLYRTLAGARISLLVGIAGALISFFVGTAYGLVAGYAGGKWDSAMMRGVEILYSIPRLIIILVAINAFDAHLKKWLSGGSLDWLSGYSRIVILVLSLGLIEWLTMARIVRGQVLALKSQQFVAAARSLGQSHVKIITRHLLPNLVGVVIIYLTLTIPAVILDESFLSFLGLGIQAPQASWGSLLSDGAQVINPIHSYWWLLVFPAIAMSATLLALNFLGDTLRDALDPRK